MSPRPRSQVARTRAQQATWRPAWLKFMIVTGICAAVVLIMSETTMAAGAKFTPPPAPPIPPVIGNDYSNDADKDCIDDRLHAKSTAAKKLSTSETKSRDLSAQATDEAVSIELIFSKPVTQNQIDAFVGLGGTITYMYQTISYGWIGRVPLDSVSSLADLMGSSLVLVEPTLHVRRYNTDRATSGGRVRAVWKAGFAGSSSGFSGDANTTIGFCDTGVDSFHGDLAGRMVYWKDLTSGNSSNAIDTDGHGTSLVGMAMGTGKASGVAAGPFTFTYTDPTWDYGNGYLTYPIGLADGPVSITTTAWWTGASADLFHLYWPQGALPGPVYPIGSYTAGTKSMVLQNSFTATSTQNYSAYLFNPSSRYLTGAVLVTTVSTYPAVSDGFTRFRGVAPGCNYAMVRIPIDGTESEFENGLSAGLDLLVTNRLANNIKIISLSVGCADDATGLPMQSISLRNKITSTVNNGVIVALAAGNSAGGTSAAERAMADPARAALAITVGASNEKNALTDYSSYGFASPDTQSSEDYKPDLIAPGGSFYYSCLALPDSGTSDALGADKEPNDYVTTAGTSFSSPFVAGCAALVIQAMEQQGTQWDFRSSSCPRFVKMVLCATASETNAYRESGVYSPTLQRAVGGPSSFPSGKDPYEGYGLVNADAAVEAVTLAYTPGSTATETLGSGTSDRRVWARRMDLKSGRDVSMTLTNPSAGDFDLYLYSGTPADSGTPVLLASSTNAGTGVAETLTYSPTADAKALLVIKRVSGLGTFTVKSTMPGPPIANDVSASATVNSTKTITLDAADDGLPNPPGGLTYTIASLPRHGGLERADGGAAIVSVPATLPIGVNQVVYRPNAAWLGDDSFTYYSDDGGTAPHGGQSNTATVVITTVSQVTVTYQVSASADDVYILRGLTMQDTTSQSLSLGTCNAAVRFTHVNIPRGSHIVGADLKIRSYTTGLLTTMTATIRAEAADNSPDFSARSMTQLTMTTATQSWLLDTGWQSNTWYQSPDIASVVQDVINRPGWSPDNALVIVCVGDTKVSFDRKFWSYDGDPASAPQLEITYQP
jgi:hypothetical protein